MITTRSPLVSEITALATLGRETFVETFAHLYDAHDLNAFLDRCYSVEGVTSDFHNPHYRYQVASKGDDMIGYCKIGFSPTFDDYDVGGKAVVELKQLYVSSDFQGEGVAPVLMDWALHQATAHGAEEMVLSVWSGNERAQRFYRRYGFDWVADTHFMVGNHRDDEFLFMKPMA